ncbi:hypothetical protein NN561_003341 [Cricetulus griseus]
MGWVDRTLLPESSETPGAARLAAGAVTGRRSSQWAQGRGEESFPGRGVSRSPAPAAVAASGPDVPLHSPPRAARRLLAPAWGVPARVPARGPPSCRAPLGRGPGRPLPRQGRGPRAASPPLAACSPLLPLHPRCREGGVSTLPCPLPSVTPIPAEHGGPRGSLAPFPGDPRGAAEPRHAGFTLFRQDKGTRALRAPLPSLLAQWLAGPCAALKSFLNRKADTFPRSTLSAHFPGATNYLWELSLSSRVPHTWTVKVDTLGPIPCTLLITSAHSLCPVRGGVENTPLHLVGAVIEEGSHVLGLPQLYLLSLWLCLSVCSSEVIVLPVVTQLFTLEPFPVGFSDFAQDHSGSC